MRLKFINPELEYSIDSILPFHDGTHSEFWTNSLFYFYPKIDKNKFNTLTEAKRREYLRENLSEAINFKELDKKVIDYQNYWDANAVDIQKALEDAFEIPLSDKLNDMIANITLNPICPRFLEDTRFDIFHLNSEKGALGMALHEIIHFIWFFVWNTHFQDDKNEYESPHLKWIFSEMVVDPIMRHDKRLHSINPYFESGCVYDYFYSMKIGGNSILETMLSLYENNSINAFMEKGYKYCLDHEEEIRNQMK